MGGGRAAAASITQAVRARQMRHFVWGHNSCPAPLTPRGRDLRDTFTPAFNQIRRRRMHLPPSVRLRSGIFERPPPPSPPSSIAIFACRGAASWRYRTSPNSRPAVRRRSGAGHCELRCYRRNPWRASLIYRTGFKKDGGENKAVSWIRRERTAKTVNCCNYSNFV